MTLLRKFRNFRNGSPTTETINAQDSTAAYESYYRNQDKSHICTIARTEHDRTIELVKVSAATETGIRNFSVTRVEKRVE